MRKEVISFNDKIEYDSVTNLIDLVSTSEARSIDIYFASSGGSVDQMTKLLDFFDRKFEDDSHNNPIYPEIKQEVNFIFNDQICSCAFEFAVKVKADSKTVLKATMSKLHMYTGEVNYRDNVLNTQDPYIKYLKSLNEEYKDFLYTCGVEDDNIKAVMDTKDVIIFEDRIRKCIEQYASEETSKEKV